MMTPSYSCSLGSIFGLGVASAWNCRVVVLYGSRSHLYMYLMPSPLSTLCLSLPATLARAGSEMDEPPCSLRVPGSALMPTNQPLYGRAWLTS